MATPGAPGTLPAKSIQEFKLVDSLGHAIEFIDTGTVGESADGTLTFGANPADGDPLPVLNGITFTFKDDPSGSLEVQIGEDLPATLQNLEAVLNQSSNVLISVATYVADETTLSITFDSTGTAGNSYTIGASTPNVTRSGATLTGGVNNTHVWNIPVVVITP